MLTILTGDNMEKNEAIKCSVEDCNHYNEKYCSLDKIKVAHCTPSDAETKENTMCDSYEKE